MFLLALRLILLVASFTFPWLGWFGFVALVPLIVLAERTAWSRRKFMLLVWLTGFVFFLINMLWMRQPAPNSFPGLDGTVLAAAVHLSWVLMAAILSVQFLGLAWLIYSLKSRLLVWRSGIYLAVGMGLFEFGRSWLCSVLIWGPGATLGPHWNFGSLGLAASGTPLVFLGRFVGLYGLTMAVVAANLAVFYLVRRRYLRAFLIITPLVAINLVAALAYPANSKAVSVGTIQIDRNQETSYGGPLKQLLNDRSLRADVDLLVLPEYSNFYTTALTADRREILDHFFTGNTGAIVTAGSEHSGESKYNQVIFFNPAGYKISVQNKHFLINAGELMPVILDIPLRLAGQAKVSEQFVANQGRTRGEKPEEPVDVNGVKVGALACSGVIAPELYRDITRRGAEILTNSAALSIFATTGSFYHQTDQMTRFHAVANARPFVQAGKGAYSFVLDSNGKTLYRAPNSGLDASVNTVATSNSKTLYTLLGEWLVPLGALSAVIIWLTGRKKPDTL